MMNSAGGESLTPILRAQGATFHPDAVNAFSMETAFSGPPIPPPPPPPVPNQAPSPSPSPAPAPNSISNHHSMPSIAMASQHICKRCFFPGSDVKLRNCGCCFHARCTPLTAARNLGECPSCRSPVQSVFLLPMNFDEIDAARQTAAQMAPSSKRGKKRKNATLARLNPSLGNAKEDSSSSDGADLRTGRWTSEETLYCDKLIAQYEAGSLPIVDGMKLNDFLSSMLKSKQSRLTKKMKNAKLSTRAYKATNGFIASFEDAKEFSAVEIAFYDSISCDLERAEIRFHMQKEWRELFSSFCMNIGQKLDADSWLSSVEEMDRRISRAKDTARMARRKIMMGYALSQDSTNKQEGVFIDNGVSQGAGSSEMSDAHLSAGNQMKSKGNGEICSLKSYSSPFVGRVIQYLDRHNLPFEHIDAWVPSFITNGEQQPSANNVDQKCRLCFSGFATAEFKLSTDGGTPEPLSKQDRYDLLSFGDYSSKFSFDVGCGLPGRVYSSGICSWEQGVGNAPSHQFERCGGANQWGIKTVLGVPIPSPNVGRIVVLFYSRFDRPRDAELVRRITEELTKLVPTPKWKLVVDVGATTSTSTGETPSDNRIKEVLKLITENMPNHPNSPYASYLPGFSALRELMSQQTRTEAENDLLQTTLDSYSSYLKSRRQPTEIAWMLARDFILLSQSQISPQPPGPAQASASVVATPLLLGGASTNAHSGLTFSSSQPSAAQLSLNPNMSPLGGILHGHASSAGQFLLGGMDSSSAMYRTQAPNYYKAPTQNNP